MIGAAFGTAVLWRRRQPLRWLAWVAVCVGLAGTALQFGAVVLPDWPGIATAVKRDVIGVSQEEIERARRDGEPIDINAADLELGDCFDSSDLLHGGSESIDWVRMLPCDRSHDFEVYSVSYLRGDTYPGDLAVEASGRDRCISAYGSFVGREPERSVLDVRFLLPSRTTWDTREGRVVQCTVFDPAGSTTGTLRNARR